ncbi:ephexin-1-like [Suricata suricatta]|uniref:ephexin-1-like n=1 Tax=Suricata suricatta TaxID=37032 RepID=UPI0011558FEE|nr:ephexin-1-like [Suricata suricatta]
MATRISEGFKKPWKKLMSGSQETDNERASVRPEVVSEEKMPHAPDPEMQDEEPCSFIPVQRNSIFKRSMRRKSKIKARDTPEQNTHHLADSLENGQSVDKPLTSDVPPSSTPRWRTPTEPDPGAQRTRVPGSFHSALHQGDCQSSGHHSHSPGGGKKKSRGRWGLTAPALFFYGASLKPTQQLVLLSHWPTDRVPWPPPLAEESREMYLFQTRSVSTPGRLVPY